MLRTRALATAGRALFVVLAVELLVFGLSTIPGVRPRAGFINVIDGWLQGSLYVTAALLALLRPLVSPVDRRLWIGVGLAMAARACGFVILFSVVRPPGSAALPVLGRCELACDVPAADPGTDEPEQVGVPSPHHQSGSGRHHGGARRRGGRVCGAGGNPGDPGPAGQRRRGAGEPRLPGAGCAGVRRAARIPARVPGASAAEPVGAEPRHHRVRRGGAALRLPTRRRHLRAGHLHPGAVGDLDLCDRVGRLAAQPR